MRYEDSIEYLEKLYHRAFVPSSQAGLDRAAFLLEQVGNPHRSLRAVHVAGSTGKGSTSAMVAGILRAAGFRTGEFRSPHLNDYTERVAVDGEDITRDEWSALVARLIPIADRMDANDFPGYSLGRPTLFELLFALAALHLQAAEADWVVLETGLGGRLDATNLVQSDVAVITNISLEHTQILGSTVTAIAQEKAAIIKPHSSAVTAATGEALAVIEEHARALGAPLLVVGRDIHVDSRADGDQRVLSLRGGATRIDARLPSPAAYQAANAATAFATAVALRNRGIGISGAAIRSGLETIAIPGRFEILGGTPQVVLDGAHNLAGMQALARSLQTEHDVLLFAAMDDKDIEGMARTIAGSASTIVVTRVPGTARSASLERLEHAFHVFRREVVAVPDPDEALDRASTLAGSGSLLVTGSLYLVGLARRRLMQVPA